jgi:virulence factor Mce-like protein
MSMRESISRRMEPLRGDSPNYSAKTGAVVVGVIALFLLMAVTQYVPIFGGASGRVMRAEFTAANQVNHFTPVRVAGVNVGKVESVGAGKTPGTATVTMRITNKDVVVRSDARADVRWRTVLGGNMFIDLQPGSPSAPRLGAATIPASRTSSQAELDDVTQMFDRGTDQRQRAMLRGLRSALSDPNGIGRTIETMGPALKTIGRGLEPLRGRESDDLRALVATTARTVAGLGHDPAMLQDLVTGADRTLAVTAAQRRRLGELIALAPGSLDSTLSTMRRLRTTLGHLDPLVGRLRTAAPSIAPAARAATPALERTRALLRAARPLLKAAGPTLTALKRASANGVPLLNELDPTVRRLNAELLPFLDRRDSSTQLRTYEAIGPFFSSVDSIAAPFNDAGHLLQFAVAPGPNSVLTANSPPAGALAPAVSDCRTSVPSRARAGCSTAARLLTKIFGGRR